jgi:hypothetical protein
MPATKRLGEKRVELRRRQFQLLVQQLDNAALGRFRQFARLLDLLERHEGTFRLGHFEGRVH